jgi:uncharacterized iron-regulated membrane protein
MPAIVTQDSLIALARSRDPDWRLLTMQAEPNKAGGTTFIIDRSLGGQPQHRAVLVLAEGTGNVLRWEPFSALTGARKLRSIFRFAHTGEIGGILGQTLAGLVSAGALVLVYTGTTLALRRFVAWRRRGGGVASADQPATPSAL